MVSKKYKIDGQGTVIQASSPKEFVDLLRQSQGGSAISRHGFMLQFARQQQQVAIRWDNCEVFLGDLLNQKVVTEV